MLDDGTRIVTPRDAADLFAEVFATVAEATDAIERVLRGRRLLQRFPRAIHPQRNPFGILTAPVDAAKRSPGARRPRRVRHAPQWHQLTGSLINSSSQRAGAGITVTMFVFTPVCRDAKHAGAPTDTLQPNRDSRSSKAQWEDIMRCIKLAWTSLAAFMLLGAHAQAAEFSAHFSGFQEIGGLGAGETGAIFSQGKGTLELDLNKNANALVFKLTYSGLGSGVTQAHVHFGKVHVAGGIIVFFCSNLGNGPSGTPACPQAGTVTGGGFKQSSQHLNEGGCDGHSKATITPFWTIAVAVTGAAASSGAI